MELADQMQDPEFWRRLAPDMNTSGMAIGPTIEIQPRALDILHREVTTQGYSQLDDALPLDEINDLLRAMEAVRRVGLQPLYIFAFDEAWSVFLRLSAIWKRMLGPDWAFLPALWAWWVDAGPTNAGWPAHRDRGKQVSVRDDGTPMSMTAWIPLTRAVPANGCMYVLPMGLEFEKLNLKTIQNARALPASPGSVLMWNQKIWHWSGTSSRRALNPRVSLSIELQTRSVPPFQGVLLDPMTSPPPLNKRLALIGAQTLQYVHFSKLEGEPVKLAEALVRYS